MRISKIPRGKNPKITILQRVRLKTSKLRKGNRMRVENRSGLRWSVLFAMVAVRALVKDAVALERKTVTVVMGQDAGSVIIRGV